MTGPQPRGRARRHHDRQAAPRRQQAPRAGPARCRCTRRRPAARPRRAAATSRASSRASPASSERRTASRSGVGEERHRQGVEVRADPLDELGDLVRRRRGRTAPRRRPDATTATQSAAVHDVGHERRAGRLGGHPDLGHPARSPGRVVPAVALQLPGTGADVALQGGRAAPQPGTCVARPRVALEAAGLLLDLAQRRRAGRRCARPSGGPTWGSRIEIARARSTAAKNSARRCRCARPGRARAGPAAARAPRWRCAGRASRSRSGRTPSSASPRRTSAPPAPGPRRAARPGRAPRASAAGSAGGRWPAPRAGAVGVAAPRPQQALGAQQLRRPRQVGPALARGSRGQLAARAASCAARRRGGRGRARRRAARSQCSTSSSALRCQRRLPRRAKPLGGRGPAPGAPAASPSTSAHSARDQLGLADVLVQPAGREQVRRPAPSSRSASPVSPASRSTRARSSSPIGCGGPSVERLRRVHRRRAPAGSGRPGTRRSPRLCRALQLERRGRRRPRRSPTHRSKSLGRPVAARRARGAGRRG